MKKKWILIRITNVKISYVLKLLTLTIIIFWDWSFSGQLSGLHLSPIDSSAGAMTLYRVEFTTSTTGKSPYIGIYDNSVIQIYLWGPFDVSGVIMAASDSSSMTGGIKVKQVVSTPNPGDSSIVILERDGTGNHVAGGTRVRIMMANICNPTTPGSNYHIFIRTLSSSNGTEIDSKHHYDTFSIVPAAPDHFDLSGYPAQTSAGATWPGNVNVVVRDRFDNRVTDFSDSLTIAFSSTDRNSSTQLPSDSTLTAIIVDTIKFSGSLFKLTRSGLHYVYLYNKSDSTKKSATEPVKVLSGTVDNFVLSTPTNVRAGEQFSLEVTAARDLFGNPASTIVHVAPAHNVFNAPDGTPPNLHEITVVDGTGNARQTLYCAGHSVRLRGYSGLAADTTSSFYIRSGIRLAGFNLSGYPNIVTAGNNFNGNNVTVTAKDIWGNDKDESDDFTAYRGTVRFTSSDALANVPGAYTFLPADAGQHTFAGTAFTLATAGQQTITVSDDSIAETSKPITIISGNIDNFDVNVIPVQVAGVVFTVEITNAVDSEGNPASGTIAITFNDTESHLAPDGTASVLQPITVTGGSGTGNQILFKAETGIQLLATANGKTKTTGAITVIPGNLDFFTIAGYPDTVNLGENFGPSTTVTVAAFDAYGNKKTNYNGSVRFSSATDPSARLPEDSPLNQGQGNFSGTKFEFYSNGNHTFTVSDIGTTITQTTDIIFVKNPDSFVITRINPSQPAVTRQQSTPWYIDVIVQNTGSRDIPVNFNASNTYVRLSKSSNWVTGEYTIVTPMEFLGGGTILSRDGKPSTIRYHIIQTGTSTGDLTILARVQSVNGLVEDSNSSQVYGSLTVQEPEQIDIEGVWTIPLSVTINDTVRQWLAGVAVANTGGSDVIVNFASTDIVFDDSSGFRWLKPDKFTSGQAVLGTGTTDTLRYTITRTGSKTGDRFVSARISYRVVNSEQDSSVIEIPPTRGARVVVQNPPKVSIETMVTDSPRAGFVNSGQNYQVRVSVTNGSPGENYHDEADSVQVWVYSKDNLSNFSGSNVIDFDSIIGDSTSCGQTALHLTAPHDTSGIVDTLFARIIRAKAQNTGLDATIIAAMDSTAIIHIESPATLIIDSLSFSTETIPANSVIEWYIYVHVHNSGDAPLLLDSVKATDIVITDDYVVEPGSFNPGDSLLYGPKKSIILTYKVKRTGAAGGQVTVTARLRGTDQNDLRRLEASKIDTITIVTTAAVQIATARIINAPNYDVEKDIAHLNTGQDVTVSVVVTNRGAEILDSVIVVLDAQTLQPNGPDSLVISTIGVGDDSIARFALTTGLIENLKGDTVFARIIYAKGRISNLPATIKPAADSITVVKTYVPGMIFIQNTETDLPNPKGTVSFLQEFPIDIQIKNIGSEDLLNVVINLAIDHPELADIISTPMPDTITRIPGHDSAFVRIRARAGISPGAVTFTTAILAATGLNTGNPVVIIPGGDSTTRAIVEKPASFVVNDIILSDDVVQIGKSWFIKAVVSDTGAADVELTNITATNIKVIIDGVDRVPSKPEEGYRGYSIDPPTGLSKSGNTTLVAGTVDTLVYAVTYTGEYAGMARVEVVLTGYDKNIGSTGGLSAANFDSVMIASDAWIYLRTVKIDAPHIQDGIGLLNTNQPFGLDITLQTSKIQAVDSIVVMLETNGGSVIVDTVGQLQQNLPDTIVIADKLPANSFTTITFNLCADSSAVQELYLEETFTARILRARLPDGEKPAKIEAADDSTATIHIHNKAELVITLLLSESEPDSIITAGATFQLVARVKNMGTALPGSDGMLHLEVPDGYSLQGSANRNFNVDDDLVFNLIAPSYSSETDTFTISITNPGLDLNSHQPAAIRAGGDSASLVVSTVVSRMQITEFAISEPMGAKDDTLSTDQTFKVKLNVLSTSNLAGRKVVLTAPSFTIYGKDTLALEQNQVDLIWSLRAPHLPTTDAEITALAAGMAGVENIVARDTLTIYVFEKAQLIIDDFYIAAPPGARDSTFTMGQDSILIQARVRNDGIANVDTSGTLVLDLTDSGGLSFVENSNNKTEKPFRVGKLVEWLVRAPQVIINSKEVRASFGVVPNDENTNEPAVQEGDRTLTVSTEKGGFVQIDSFYISDPPGSMDDTVSTDQTFDVVGIFSAGQVNDNLVTATIYKDANYDVLGVEEQIIPVVGHVNRRHVTWRIQAPEYESGVDDFYFTLQAVDRNNGVNLCATSDFLKVVTESRTKFKLTAQIVSPPGARNKILSTGQDFVIKVSAHNMGKAGYFLEDSFVVKIAKPPGYKLIDTPDEVTLIDSGDGIPSALYFLQAQDNPSAYKDIFKFQLIGYPRDINTNRGAALDDVDGMEYEVETVTKTKLSLLSGINSVLNEQATLWVGQTFAVVTEINNDGVASPDTFIQNGFSFKITSPCGYTLKSDSIQTSNNGRVSWLFQTPSLPTYALDTIKVEMLTWPPDQYSGKPAVVLKSRDSIFVMVKTGILVAQDYPTGGPQVSAVSGESDLPTLGLRLENPGDNIRGAIHVNRVSIKFKTGKSGNKVINPRSLISCVRLVNHGNPAVKYAEITEIPEKNPVHLYCSLEKLVIQPNSVDSVDINVDLLPGTTVSGFLVSIDSCSHIEAIDQNSNSLMRIGKAANTPATEQELNIISNYRAIMSTSTPKTVFINYPNPFGDRNNELTKFWYYLKKDSDIEFRIYSLAGELVLANTYGSTDRQGQKGIHEGDITWDGKNGNGNVVRNGVYIAYLKIKNGKSYMTKVAVAK